MTVNSTAIMSVAVADYATRFLAAALFRMSRAMTAAVKRVTMHPSLLP
jgi:hypothetical protein